MDNNNAYYVLLYNSIADYMLWLFTGASSYYILMIP